MAKHDIRHRYNPWIITIMNRKFDLIERSIEVRNMLLIFQ